MPVPLLVVEGPLFNDPGHRVPGLAFQERTYPDAPNRPTGPSKPYKGTVPTERRVQAERLGT